MRLLFLLVTAAGVAAQASGPLDEARARLAAGDSTAALYVVKDAIRAGDDTPDLLRLRLRLEVDGAGLAREHMLVRRQELRWAGQALLDQVPADTFALRVLADEAVWGVLESYDRVRPAQLRGEFTELLSVQEETARMRRSRFDTQARRAIAPDDDMSYKAEEAHQRALEYLQPWLAADPGAARAYDNLAILAVASRNADALATVARRFAAATDLPRAGLYLGLAQHLQGDDPGAERTFRDALARLPAVERERLEDVRMLLPTSQQALYAASPDSVAAAFWAATDVRRLTPVHERRVEHYARVVEADLLFGRFEWDASFSLAPSRGAETQKGRIWVRYGRPPLTLSMEPTGRLANPNTIAFVVWEHPDFRYVFGGAEGELIEPSASAYSSRRGDTVANDDYVMQDRYLRREDPERTQDLAETALDLPVLVSRFRIPGGGTEAVVAFGLPDDAPQATQTGVFAVWGGGVRQRVVAPRLVGRSRVGAETLSFPLAGRVEVEAEADSGAVRGRVVHEVAPLSGGFGVSDLLLATSTDDEGPGLIVRDGIAIVPAAQAVFSTADPVYVYLEAYGLGLEDGQSRYTVEAALTPDARRGGLAGRMFGRGQDPGVAVKTEAEGSRSTEAISFFVDTGDQEPGTYTLRVEVADEVMGQTASAERRVVLE